MIAPEPLSEGFLFLRFLAGTAVVLGLLGGLAWGLRYGAAKGWIKGMPTRTGGQQRLALLESMPLDARRRLVLVSCDKSAYLLLLAPDHSLVVASVPAPIPPAPAP